MEEFKADGRARSIGASNFQAEHLERLAAETGTVPAVNQIELHPYFQNREVAGYDEQHGIATEAWSPIAQGEVLDDATIGEIAEQVGRTPAQVVLRWHVQHGYIVFPKSVTPDRIRENFELWDFELDRDAMERIDSLDRGEAGRTRPAPGALRLRALELGRRPPRWKQHRGGHGGGRRGHQPHGAVAELLGDHAARERAEQVADDADLGPDHHRVTIRSTGTASMSRPSEPVFARPMPTAASSNASTQRGRRRHARQRDAGHDEDAARRRPAAVAGGRRTARRSPRRPAMRRHTARRSAPD